jgi:hypothetical protein
MNRPACNAPSWSTSSFSDAVDSSPMELSVLGDHLGRCKESNGRMFTVRCFAESLNGVLAGRLVTTVVVATVLIGGGSLLM